MVNGREREVKRTAGLSNYGRVTVTRGGGVENDHKKVGLWSLGDHKISYFIHTNQ